MLIDDEHIHKQKKIVRNSSDQCFFFLFRFVHFDKQLCFFFSFHMKTESNDMSLFKNVLLNLQLKVKYTK